MRCMSASELAMWIDANERAGGYNRAGSPCDDCPAGHALEMRAVGLCDGHPGGVEDEEELPPPMLSDARREQLRQAALRYRARLAETA